MPKVVKFNTKQLIQAIKGTGGIMTIISQKLNCEWHVAKRLIEENEKAKKILLDEKEGIIDRAEKVIIDAIIKKDDIQISKWVLSTIGKNRGYSEKQEIEHSGSLKTDTKLTIIGIDSGNTDTAEDIGSDKKD